MAEQTLRYTVVLGDWSDDGHGRFDSYQIELFTESPELELTEELIVANYRANVEKLGFGLPELWDEYEKTSPSVDHIIRLRDILGAVLYLDEEEEDLEEIGFPGEFRSAHEFSDGILPFGGLYVTLYEGDLYIEMDEPLDLAMFIVLAGLPGVGWRKLQEAPVLFGSGGAALTGNRHVGYGLYF